MMTKFVRVFLKNCFADFFLLALDVSSQLLSVIENDVKIRPILINSEFILFIMNLFNNRYAYFHLNLEFWYTSLCHCTIHFKVKRFQEPCSLFYDSFFLSNFVICWLLSAVRKLGASTPLWKKRTWGYTWKKCTWESSGPVHCANMLVLTKVSVLCVFF